MCKSTLLIACTTFSLGACAGGVFDQGRGRDGGMGGGRPLRIERRQGGSVVEREGVAPRLKHA